MKSEFLIVTNGFKGTWPAIEYGAWLAGAMHVKLTLLGVTENLSPAAIDDHGPLEDVFERAIELFARVSNGGLFLPPNTTNNVHRALIIALAARHRLPAVYAFGFFVADGGLMSYAIDQVDMFRQTASYVDRILRGARRGPPGDGAFDNLIGAFLQLD